MSKLVLKEETYKVIGACMQVHRELGPGFLEVVYKDALECEFRDRNIPFNREVEFKVRYRRKILRHRFFADFTVFDSVILEVKAVNTLHEKFAAQTFNYLKVSDYRVGLLANFGEPSVVHRRYLL